MPTGLILRLSVFTLIVSAVGACSSIGPGTVERDRLDYGSAIADSWKQQTLLNIVKLRYGDFPVFLDITQVIAGYQLQSTGTAGFTAGNASGPSVGPTVLGGSLSAQGSYTDRPTLIYTPLTGNDFLKRLMSPIPPSALLFMLQSGYPADQVLTLALNSINGISNESRRVMSRAAHPQFKRLGQLLRELQLADALQIRIGRPKGTLESIVIAFPPSGDAQIAAKSAEIRSILKLRPGLQQFEVNYGGNSGADDEISMVTRSMLQIMAEVGAAAQVPGADVASGRAAPGAVDDRSAGETQTPPLLNIVSGDAPPKDAYVAVPYDGHWYSIADTDIRSKYAFGFVMLLFSVADTGLRASPPVLSLPTGP